jgi:hypothetical protein
MNKVCPKNYHYHPNHPKSDAFGCMKNSDMCTNGYYYQPNNKNSNIYGCVKNNKENYGSFSISAAVRASPRYDVNGRPYLEGVT